MRTNYYTIDHVSGRRTFGGRPLRHAGRAVVAYRISTRNGVSSIRLGVSFCSPVDEFSFEDGKRIASERLDNAPVTLSGVTGLRTHAGVVNEQAVRATVSRLITTSRYFPNWARQPA